MSPATADLLALHLTLRPDTLPPAADAPLTGSADSGRAAHAILLAALNHSDPALAESTHAGDGPRPFTASALLGTQRHKPLTPERTYGLRFTALSAPVATALQAAIQPTGPLAPGATLRFGTAYLHIEAAALAPTEHSAADSTTYGALSAPWLLATTKPTNRINLRFLSPTTFKSAGHHIPVPLPSLVFGSLLERWNALAPVALPPETRRYADEALALTAYDLRTLMVPLKAGALRVGAVGVARYTALTYDRYWLSILHLLADFAFYAGVGASTTMGLGQCHAFAADTDEA